MSFFITAVAISAVGVGMSAYAASESSKAQGKEAVRRGNLQQTEAFINEEYAKVDAEAVKQRALAESINIKRQALNMRAGLVNAQSGSGVVIGEGSAQAALDQIDTLASADALAALYEGGSKAVKMRIGADMTGEAGRNAAKSGALTGSTMGAAAQLQLTAGLISAAGTLGKAFAPTPTTGGKP